MSGYGDGWDHDDDQSTAEMVRRSLQAFLGIEDAPPPDTRPQSFRIAFFMVDGATVQTVILQQGSTLDIPVPTGVVRVSIAALA